MMMIKRFRNGVMGMKERERTQVVEDETTIYEIDLECQKCLARESQDVRQTENETFRMKKQPD